MRRRTFLLAGLGLTALLSAAGCHAAPMPDREDIRTVARAYADALEAGDPAAAGRLALPRLRLHPDLGPTQARFRRDVVDEARSLVAPFEEVDEVAIEARSGGYRVPVGVQVVGTLTDGAPGYLRARSIWILAADAGDGFVIVGHGAFRGDVQEGVPAPDFLSTRPGEEPRGGEEEP